MRLALFISLKSLFMDNEQCQTRVQEKKCRKRNAISKRHLYLNAVQFFLSTKTSQFSSIIEKKKKKKTQFSVIQTEILGCHSMSPCLSYAVCSLKLLGFLGKTEASLRSFNLSLFYHQFLSFPISFFLFPKFSQRIDQLSLS